MDKASFDTVEVGDILCDTTYSPYGEHHNFYKVLTKKGKSTIVLAKMRRKFSYNGPGYTEGTVFPDGVDEEFRQFSVRFTAKGAHVDGGRLMKWNGIPAEWYNFN